MTDDELDLFIQLLLKFMRGDYKLKDQVELNKATVLLLEWANEERNKWQKDNNY